MSDVQVSRDLKFVGSDRAGLPLKRKQVQQACDACRRKKKRCTHADGFDAGRKAGDRPDLDTIAASQLLHLSSHERVAEYHGNRSHPGSSDHSPAFIGDLNPESILLHAVAVDDDKASQDPAVPGLWYTPRQVSHPAEGAGDVAGSKEAKTNKKRKRFASEPFAEHSQAARDMAARRSVEMINGNQDEHDDMTRDENPLSDVEQAGDAAPNAMRPDGPPAITSMTEPCQCPGNAPRTVQGCHACLLRLIDQANECLIDSAVRDVLPAVVVWRGIKNLYHTKIQPILPIFDMARLDRILDPRRPGLSRIDQLIVASVCHAISFDPSSDDYLHMSQSTGAQRYQKKVVGLATELVKCIDKRRHLFDYLRAMTLLCFFWQAGTTNPQAPIDGFADVVLLVHTHGLHFGRSRPWKQSNWTARGFDNPPDLENFIMLFSCILALDRINAASYGRPVLLNERDCISTEYLWGDKLVALSQASQSKGDSDPSGEAASQKQTPVFRLFMSIIFYLDRVIELYRPDPKWHEVTPPVFEQLVLDAGAENEFPSMLATLEVLYHGVSVLSVRMTQSLFQESQERRTTEQRDPDARHLPSPNLNARRSLSADRILWIVNAYRLSAMPFIPYAMSLALSVAYRKWRFSKVAMFRSRGRASFTAATAALSGWAQFTTAHRNIALANAVIQKMNEIEDSVRHGPSNHSSRRASPPVAQVPWSFARNTAPDGAQGSMAAEPSPRTRPGARNETGPQQHTEQSRATATGKVVASPNETIPASSMAGSRVTTAAQTPMAVDMMDVPHMTGPHIPVPPAVLQDASGFDVFSHVDKGLFPQGTVDYAFYSNLDLTVPSHKWPDIDVWNPPADMAGGQTGDWNMEGW